MTHKGWHSRNYLPHFDSQDVVQFVTFRLAESLPTEAIQRLKAADRPETLRHEMLDSGWGACWLRSEPIARLVEDSFLAFDGTRYRLHAWTVMPNHVHVLFTVGAVENYIDENPVKAGLVGRAALWPYGSARLKA